jgi:hypothetical protein
MIRRLGLVVLLASGCLDAIGPEVGPLARDAAGSNDGPACGGDSDPTVVIAFQADVLDGVFRRGGCRDCHTDNGLGVRQSGLDLTSYSTLRRGGGRTGASIVIDHNPCDSLLVQKIEVGPPFGRRMPYNGPPYLAAADQQIVRDWIAEGARDN